MLQKLRGRGVAHALELVDNPEQCYLVLEDSGGELLSHWLEEQPFRVEQVLHVLLQAAQALEHIHSQSVVHSNIHPGNLMWSSSKGMLQLMNLQYARFFLQGEQAFSSDDSLVVDPTYMSPEQIGRTNQGVDYRSDLYSLGATAWHMLVGEAPFSGAAFPQLRHAHLAHHPMPPSELRGEVPSVLSDIVLRLMAKQPRQRYQSARGLWVDLQKCLSLFHRSPTATFSLGSEDRSLLFRIPKQLYGREQENKLLVQQLSRVQDGKPAKVFVSGPPGIGKSALVRTLESRAREAQGYFVMGRFEQYQSERPYHAFVTALQSLVQQILLTSEQARLSIQNKLNANVLDYSGLLVRILPSLSHLFQSIQEAPPLIADKAVHRMRMALSALLKTLSSPEHPLVLCMDDLQWADDSSLALLSFLLSDTNLKGLLLVGCYREHEVDEQHPLWTIVERAKGSCKIQLKVLERLEIAKLVADSCQCSSTEAMPLAEVLLQKTAGNPFFLHVLLERYAQDGLFTPTPQGWSWHLENIRSSSVADNVVEYLLDTLQQLPTETQKLLLVASCLGHQFQSDILAEALENKHESLEQQLLPVLKAGYLIQEREPKEPKDGYVLRFAHDRIQEAAASLGTQKEKGETHWKIGQFLLKSQPQSLFSTVGHLQQGWTHTEDSIDKELLVGLAWEAGNQARESAAFGSAFTFFEWGLEVLGDEQWEPYHDLTLKLTCASAEAGHLSQQFAVVEQHIQTVMDKALNLTEQLPMWRLLLRQRMSEMQLEEAFQVIREFLLRAGAPIVRSPNLLKDVWQLMRVFVRIGWRSPEDLLELPISQDPIASGVIEMQTMAAPAYQILRPHWAVATITRDVLAVLRHGITGPGAQCWTGYGLILSVGFGLARLGARYSELSLLWVDKLNRKDLWPRFSYIHHFVVLPMSQPLREIFPNYRSILQQSLVVGDVIVTSLVVAAESVTMYVLGSRLEALAVHAKQSGQVLERFQFQAGRHFLQMISSTVTLLQQQRQPAFPILLPEGKDKGEQDTVHMMHGLLLVHLNLLFGEHRAAFQAAMSYPLIWDGPVSLTLRGSCWTYALIALHHGLSKGWDSPRKVRKVIRHGLRQLRRWCKHVPQARRFRLTWVEAYRQQARKHKMKALSLYDKALQEAWEANFPHDAALIAEHAVQLCFEMERPHLAKGFLQDAVQGYQQWGAWSKVAQLRELYAMDTSLPEATGSFRQTPTAPIMLGSKTQEKSLDLETILKTAQALTEEVDTDTLLQRIIQLLLENAGAERGMLLLHESKSWTIAAEATSTNNTVRLNHASLSLDDDEALSSAMLRYVIHTREPVVLEDASQDGPFLHDPYMSKAQPRSVLCSPLVLHRELLGILYLENKQIAGLFSKEKLRVLELLATQAVVSLETVRYRQSQQQALPSQSSDRSSPEPTQHSYPQIQQHLSLYSLAGESVGDWRLLRNIGEGGMAVVYEAKHQVTEQQVAVKLLHPMNHPHDSRLSRFQKEAETLSQLDHPNIVKMYDFGQDSTYGFFMAMEYLEGLNLHSILAQHSPLPMGWLLEVLEQLCAALHLIHQHDIIHRDLKPSNLFVLPSESAPIVKLLDFGIAKGANGDTESRLTSTGAIMGTPAYLAPEQLKESQTLTPATDLYALGVVLFEALTSKHPLGEGSSIEMFVKILQRQPERLGTYRPEFSDSPLEDLLAQLLAKDPQKRPQSVVDVWDEFEMACQFLEDPLDDPDNYPLLLQSNTSPIE